MARWPDQAKGIASFPLDDSIHCGHPRAGRCQGDAKRIRTEYGIRIQVLAAMLG